MWWAAAYKLCSEAIWELCSQTWCRLCGIYQSWKPLESDYSSVCSVQLWWEINLQISKLKVLSHRFFWTDILCFYKVVFFLEENCFTLIIIIEKEENPSKKYPNPQKLSLPHHLNPNYSCFAWWSLMTIEEWQGQKSFCSTVGQCWTSLELKQ